ncbi:MAG TPA: hypothetical protein VG413_06275 [Candidatus Dormibacteraeota bacterium]|nr:hypothetical protein [Candidatus Dormibacteraeota bacterium]
MRRIPLIVAFLALTMTCMTVAADNEGFSVRARTFDPHHTFLVNATWLSGIGCPTDATVVLFDSNPPFGLLPPSKYTDPACPTGDSTDHSNQGLLLAKTGPTLNDASGTAVLVGVKGTVLTELGYDLRKPGADSSDPRGSHCGAGAARFNITLQDGEFFFLGCSSPPPTTQNAGNGFIRLRWGGATGPLQAYLNGNTLQTIPAIAVKSISIVFDEGQDTAPDNFGLAVLDNIDVNGTLVGHGVNGGDNSGDNSKGGPD